MNWDAIGAEGEVSGAVAVVATLIYLAKQIQHSAGTLEPEVWEARVNRMRRLFRDRPAARAVWATIQEDQTLGKSFTEFATREVIGKNEGRRS